MGYKFSKLREDQERQHREDEEKLKAKRIKSKEVIQDEINL